MGARVVDLESQNGTYLDGIRIRDAYLRDGCVLRLGKTHLRFQLERAANQLPVSSRSQFGSLIGDSIAMRTTFSVLERAACTDSTILVEGETGTGKEATAMSIHEESPRKDKPFVVVDCGAIPPNLLESELFGHERGAFTGAIARRTGSFEAAAGGTIFLDEIGELSSDLQPKLLRAIEQRQFRRVGSNTVQSIDVRLIAATNRDLRMEVNEGRFRSDLYFRLAVIRVRLPALRERPEDIPRLLEHMLQLSGNASKAGMALVRSPDFIAGLQRAAWPGNVRELRNHVERCLVFQQALPLSNDLGGLAGELMPTGFPQYDLNLSYQEARRQGLLVWERGYLQALLDAHGKSIDQAARAAGIGRAYLYRLLSRHR
jgi:transcriptional regulator with PAS, ATPase and Fis domain